MKAPSVGAGETVASDERSLRFEATPAECAPERDFLLVSLFVSGCRGGVLFGRTPLCLKRGGGVWRRARPVVGLQRLAGVCESSGGGENWERLRGHAAGCV